MPSKSDQAMNRLAQYLQLNVSTMQSGAGHFLEDPVEVAIFRLEDAEKQDEKLKKVSENVERISGQFEQTKCDRDAALDAWRAMRDKRDLLKGMLRDELLIRGALLEAIRKLREGTD